MSTPAFAIAKIGMIAKLTHGWSRAIRYSNGDTHPESCYSAP